MSTTIEAKVIADSLALTGDRVTTLLLTIPRIILSEFNTHRMFSRNSASSRAIPTNKMLTAIEKDPFIPIIWPKTHSGMSTDERLDESDKWHSVESWHVAVKHATSMSMHLTERYKVSKQIANRLLEPFMWHKVLVTATEWENFLALRADADAEPHMEMLSYAILNALNQSTPKQQASDKWHLPFGDQIDPKVIETNFPLPNGITDILDEYQFYSRKIVTGRCAQTSYTMLGSSLDVINPDQYSNLINLHDKLAESGHWSPFEHPCRAMNEEEYFSSTKTYLTPVLIANERIQRDYEDGKVTINKQGNNYHITEFGWSGNFRGFVQYRKYFLTENKVDSRLIKYNPKKLPSL